MSRTQDIKLSDFPGKYMEVRAGNGTLFLEFARSEDLRLASRFLYASYVVCLGSIPSILTYVLDEFTWKRVI